MPSLAVVILNYSRADLLADCLRSIYAAATRSALDVWVVDNASPDDSAAMVRRDFPQARLLVSERNGGYAYGNNLALRVILGDKETRRQGDKETLYHDVPGSAEHLALSPSPSLPLSVPDYIMLLNNDTVVPPGALDGLVDYAEAHADVGVVGPKLVLADGTLDKACRRSFPTPAVAFYRLSGLSALFPRSPRFGRYNLSYLDPDATADVDAVVGACMLLRTGVVREVGVLDETFFMYGEDLDWAYRIKQYGWRVVYYPTVTVLHYKRAASTRRAIPSIRAFYDAMRIFHRKHYAATTAAPLNALIELGITCKEAIALGRNLIRPAAARRVG